MVHNRKCPDPRGTFSPWLLLTVIMWGRGWRGVWLVEELLRHCLLGHKHPRTHLRRSLGKPKEGERCTEKAEADNLYRNDDTVPELMMVIIMCSFLCHFSFGAQGPLHETK